MAQVVSVAAVTLPLFIFPLVVGRQFYQRYLGLRDAYRDTIRSLIGALEAKDPYTRGHSVRVAVYATQIGVELGLEDDALERLEYSALLHDLGKLSLPSQILTKDSALTDDEFAAMRDHPAAGAAMVERVPPLRELAPLVLNHHERPDGRGYPGGLCADQIPVPSRILSVADAYDAMTTDRAYRGAMSPEDAAQELRDGAAKQFDEQIVDAFLRALAAQSSAQSVEMESS
jgi:HD-GYP domain-containing protein (c-di-GMP phosphodiesterase class II)